MSVYLFLKVRETPKVGMVDASLVSPVLPHPDLALSLLGSSAYNVLILSCSVDYVSQCQSFWEQGG